MDEEEEEDEDDGDILVDDTADDEYDVNCNVVELIFLVVVVDVNVDVVVPEFKFGFVDVVSGVSISWFV